jgi:hypothetical protein
VRLVLLAVLLAGAMPGPATAADHDPLASAAPGIFRTGKERLTSKGADEQRVNDCKVPAALRTAPRPGCPENAQR